MAQVVKRVMSLEDMGWGIVNGKKRCNKSDGDARRGMVKNRTDKSYDRLTMFEVTIRDNFNRILE